MANITEEEFKKAAGIIGCEVEVIKAVAKVESNGSGFNSDGSPKTLFEGHWFHKLTNGKYSNDERYKTISYSRWTKAWYGNQKVEKQRLELAISLDRNAALQSASWGAFQIMGFNYKAVGFSNIQDFVNAMYKSEGEQLIAFTNFIKSKNLGRYLISKDWAKFAYGYNGSGYAENKYDKKMKDAYDEFKKKTSEIEKEVEKSIEKIKQIKLENSEILKEKVEVENKIIEIKKELKEIELNREVKETKTNFLTTIINWVLSLFKKK